MFTSREVDLNGRKGDSEYPLDGLLGNLNLNQDMNDPLKLRISQIWGSSESSDRPSSITTSKDTVEFPFPASVFDNSSLFPRGSISPRSVDNGGIDNTSSFLSDSILVPGLDMRGFVDAKEFIPSSVSSPSSPIASLATAPSGSSSSSPKVINIVPIGSRGRKDTWLNDVSIKQKEDSGSRSPNQPEIVVIRNTSNSPSEMRDSEKDSSASKGSKSSGRSKRSDRGSSKQEARGKLWSPGDPIPAPRALSSAPTQAPHRKNI
jgi:hypothetical protein